MKEDIKTGPLMYKGFIIYNNRVDNKGVKMFSAYNYANNIHINPLYNTFDKLKLVIDAIK